MRLKYEPSLEPRLDYVKQSPRRLHAPTSPPMSTRLHSLYIFMYTYILYTLYFYCIPCISVVCPVFLLYIVMSLYCPSTVYCVHIYIIPRIFIVYHLHRYCIPRICIVDPVFLLYLVLSVYCPSDVAGRIARRQVRVWTEPRGHTQPRHCRVLDTPTSVLDTLGHPPVGVGHAHISVRHAHMCVGHT